MSVTLSELSVNWLALCRDYRPSAFWFWNADMDRDRMRSVIEEMARVDIREVLIHPIHGLTIEYLSDEYFELYRFALSLLKEHNIQVWIYDEYGWPSGNAGGLLLRKHPEVKGWLLAYNKDESGKITASPKHYDRVLDNTMGAPWTGSEGGYLDTLSSEAIHRFIEITYERYRQKCGDYFGSTIAGFFTDEPVTMMDPLSERWGVWAPIGLPWTPEFPARFKEKFNYDIEPLYPELAGDGPSKYKEDYWTLVKELHTGAYHEQISRWCREHGVKYTGHVGEDASLQQVRFAGSVYQSLSYMDIPGIDHLGHTAPPDERWADHALVPSVARHNGRDRVYCEAYGIAPLGIRLSSTLDTADMLGAYGINDIALMGFHQSLDGIRKHLYWPPLFMESPWWPFFTAYRDALSRSVGLASLGKRSARYAMLYPQYEMEQTDLFNIDIGNWENGNPGAKMIQLLGEAVYGSGETFDFVFPEMLDQARVKKGRVAFPHADYEAIIAPRDIRFFENDLEILNQISSSGGCVIRDDIEDAVIRIKSAKPSWSDIVTIETDKPEQIRVNRFAYSDGELFILRNSGMEQAKVLISSRKNITHWDTDTGKVTGCTGGITAQMSRHDTLFFTVTDNTLTDSVNLSHKTYPIDAAWKVATEKPNTARLSSIRFHHPQKEWLPAVDCSIFKNGTGRSLAGMPHDFTGFTEVEFSGEFDCASIPDELGIIFERDHLAELSVNGSKIDLAKASPLPCWDSSCIYTDIRKFAAPGRNIVTGRLKFQTFETSIQNDLVYSFGPMPTCDVFTGGSFILQDGVISSTPGKHITLPLDLSRAGYPEYSGILTLQAEVHIPPALADKITGIQVIPVAEDGVEILLDDRSLGMRVRKPYEYDIPDIAPGIHKLRIRLSSTTANLFGNPLSWGIEKVEWMLVE